jgi:mRNA interferase MazF
VIVGERRPLQARHCPTAQSTSNLKWATAPGNVLLPSSVTGLPKESVANVSQLVTLDKTDLTERAGKLSRSKLELVLSGIDVVLGR